LTILNISNLQPSFNSIRANQWFRSEQFVFSPENKERGLPNTASQRLHVLKRMLLNQGKNVDNFQFQCYGEARCCGKTRPPGPRSHHLRMKLFDSHCHLDDKAFTRDLAVVLQRAQAAGVTCMMTVGTNHRTSLQAVSLAQSHPGIFAAVGIHPHDTRHCNPAVLDDLMQLAQNPKVKAWGELGLDFNRMYSPREDQEQWFKKQLDIASRLDLPMIFHERDSRGRLLDILAGHRDRDLHGVVHCFSGGRQELKQYLDLGLYIGLTGIITMKARGRQLRELIPLIPEDRLVVETDAPYLVPAQQKKHFRRNDPAFVKSTLVELAELRRKDPEELAGIVWQNTCRLYHIAP
jgi:TatD DNase family protein